MTAPVIVLLLIFGGLVGYMALILLALVIDGRGVMDEWQDGERERREFYWVHGRPHTRQQAEDHE